MRRMLEERDRFQREKRELEEVMKKSFIEEKNRQIKKMFDSLSMTKNWDEFREVKFQIFKDMKREFETNVQEYDEDRRSNEEYQVRQDEQENKQEEDDEQEDDEQEDDEQEDDEQQEEEIEVCLWKHKGKKYLKKIEGENKVYDIKTHNFIGIWNPIKNIIEEQEVSSNDETVEESIEDEDDNTEEERFYDVEDSYFDDVSTIDYEDEKKSSIQPKRNENVFLKKRVNVDRSLSLSLIPENALLAAAYRNKNGIIKHFEIVKKGNKFINRNEKNIKYDSLNKASQYFLNKYGFKSKGSAWKTFSLKNVKTGELVSIDNINDERYFEKGLLKKSDFTLVR
jgi:hypothetical protein